MVKVVSLSNEAYETLQSIKNEDESFSDIVLRLAHKKKKNIMRIFGIAKEDKEFGEGLRRAYKERKGLKLRVY